MTIVQINTFSYKATGTIMMNIHRQLLTNGVNSYVIWGRGRTPENDHEISIADVLGIKIHGVYTRITDKTGFASKRATKKLLDKLDQIKPDIIHLHNLHGYYINVELLFNYIRKNQIKVVWTLHDCWTFTGHCAYFDIVGCQKWKTGCHKCEQLKTYPASKLLDASEWNWKRKKELFTGLDITLVTPSYWLKKLVSQSFLSGYPVEVIHNGIDKNIFKPTESNFRKKNKLENKFVILGVASEWTERKGLNDFVRLEEMLSDTINGEYKLVLVGLTKKQMTSLSSSIITLARTSNLQELIEIYSAADVFFNPTYEDNFPTTNLEALACGTPVATYRTGGSPECIDAHNGIVLKKGDIIRFEEIVLQKLIHKMGYKVDTEAIAGRYTKDDMVSKYVDLYR